MADTSPNEAKNKLLATVERVAARSRELNAKRERPSLFSAVQLPIWGEAQRGLPNSLARGALFTAVRDNSSRLYFEGAPVASLSGIDLHYRGQELRQDDASVFMTILHLARHVPLGQEVSFTAYAMLKELGWSINSKEYQHLRQCIDRLSATSVRVSADRGRVGYGGSLVRQFVWRDEQGKQLSHWKVWLEPEIVRLFGEQAFTIFDWGQRRMIGGRASLALWLHSFLCTHAEPIPMSVGKYHELSGSKSKNLFHFRARLVVALQKLKDARFLADFRIVNDLVYVQRVRRAPRAVVEAR
jgi:hypothetical protein